MIHPNMATMLCFITTDINITSKMLQLALSKIVRDTFNMVSVDGDTSTNDMVTVMASGLAGNELISEKGPMFNQFCVALKKIMREMSKDIAKDGGRRHETYRMQSNQSQRRKNGESNR